MNELNSSLEVSSKDELEARPTPVARFSIPKVKFTPEEDSRILEAVRRFGSANWESVAGCVSGRTPRQCRERWRLYLHPDLNTGPWTAHEDAILGRAYASLGSKWADIAMSLPGRTEVQIKNRWCKLSRGVPIHCANVAKEARSQSGDENPPQNLPQFPSILDLCPHCVFWAMLHPRTYGPAVRFWREFGSLGLN
jgi:hypothetical protein